MPLVTQYESHPIVQPLTRVPTAFPLVRSLDIKTGDKTTVQKLLATGEDSVAVTEIPTNGAVDPKKGKKGPLTLAAAGTISGTTPGRFVVVGSSLWAQQQPGGLAPTGNRDLFVNIGQLADLRRRPDLHPSQDAGRSAAQRHRAEAEHRCSG